MHPEEIRCDEDGQPLFSCGHLQSTPWHVRLWQFFFRPKLSKDSYQIAAYLDPKNKVFIGVDMGADGPLRDIAIKEEWKPLSKQSKQL